MRRTTLLCCLLLLLTASTAMASMDSPAQTPTSNRAFEIITNSYQGSFNQNYSSIVGSNDYTYSCL